MIRWIFLLSFLGWALYFAARCHAAWNPWFALFSFANALAAQYWLSVRRPAA